MCASVSYYPEKFRFNLMNLTEFTLTRFREHQILYNKFAELFTAFTSFENIDTSLKEDNLQKCFRFGWALFICYEMEEPFETNDALCAIIYITTFVVSQIEPMFDKTIEQVVDGLRVREGKKEELLSRVSNSNVSWYANMGDLLRILFRSIGADELRSEERFGHFMGFVEVIRNVNYSDMQK